MAAVWLGASLAGAPVLAAQDENGGVEIISGVETRREAPPGTSGVRVVSYMARAGGPATHRVVEPLRATEVLAVQEALATSGHDPGALDGLMGPATRVALRRFQNTAGVAVCGCIDYETIVGLGLRPLVIQTVIGDAADEPDVEIIAPPRAIAPEEPSPALPPDTVLVSTVTRPEGPWVYPAFPVGVLPVIVGPGDPAPTPAPPTGVPFGGRGPIRLGPPARRPPPRP